MEFAQLAYSMALCSQHVSEEACSKEANAFVFATTVNGLLAGKAHAFATGRTILL